MPHVATGDSTFTLTRSSLLASYSDHTTQQTKVPLCRPPSMSQVMVRMVHAAVKFPQIHTLRRCLRGSFAPELKLVSASRERPRQ